MTDKKGVKINIHQEIVNVIIFIVDFTTQKQNVLYNYGLIITNRILLKSLCLSFNF